MFGIGPTELLVVAMVIIVVIWVRARRVFRFSVRDLLLATAVLALVLGFVMVLGRN